MDIGCLQSVQALFDRSSTLKEDIAFQNTKAMELEKPYVCLP